MYPEIVKLEIEYDIDGFERTTLHRLLNSFETIDVEASRKRQEFLERRSNNFYPDRDDEGCIEEDGYFEELNHIFVEESLKQEFLNSTVTWLFHLFEKQQKRVLGTHLSNELKPMLLKNKYDLSTCPNWRILNKEVRSAANAIKHGNQSRAMSVLTRDYSNLIDNGNVVISKNDIERYLLALRAFWAQALHNQVVL